MQPLDFSIVVPTYNRPAGVRRLLEAIENQQYPRERFELVLVDDGGREPLTDVERQYRGRLQLKLIRQPNRGCGPARQLGVDHAAGTYLAFTDDDCCPAPDWLARLASAFAEHPHHAIGGNTVNALEANAFAEATQFIVALLTTHGAAPDGSIRYCPTSNIAFPAAEFRSAGGLDPSWKNSGGEDRDLCARWLQAGFALYYQPAAVVHHFHALTARQFLRQHFRYGRGAWLFHRADAGYESHGFYRKLLTGPFHQYAAAQATRVAAAVLLAQFATTAGFVFEAAAPRSRRT